MSIDDSHDDSISERNLSGALRKELGCETRDEVGKMERRVETLLS
jgi:hypothetical protein